MTRFVYDASVMVALLLLSILLEAANTGWPPLALFVLALVYLVLTLFDSGASPAVEWLVVSTRWVRYSTPIIALALVVSALLVWTTLAELRTLAIFSFVAYGSAVLSPIFMGLLRRLTIQF